MMRETGNQAATQPFAWRCSEATLRQETLAKAKASGAAVLIEPYISDGRVEAIIQLPDVYAVEIHAAAQKTEVGV
jgi:hypothetical protein